jgi:hypothetical protein
MWQFVAHHVMRPPLWTWRRLGRDGSIAQQSACSFASYRKAYADAVRHGFKPGVEEHEKIELKAEGGRRKAEV